MPSLRISYKKDDVLFMSTKQKKIKFNGLMVLALYALLGGVCGFLLMWYIDSALSDGETLGKVFFAMILMIVWMYVSIFASTILHELGHLVFGLLTGYKFLSYRIGKFMFTKIDGKIKLKTFNIPGTGGQCIMAPPEIDNDEYPFVLYNLGGVIMNFIVALFCFICYLCIHNMLASASLLMLAMVNVFVGVMNGIPVQITGINNDGMNTRILKHDKKSLDSFILQLRIAQSQSQDVRLADMPNEWFENLQGNNNTITSAINVFYCQRLVDMKDFENAIDEIEILLKDDNVLDMYKKILVCELIYCKLVVNRDKESVRALLSTQQKRFMQLMSMSTSVKRCEYTIALLHDDNIKQANKILGEFEKLTKKYPYKAEIESDRELIDIAQRTYEYKLQKEC